MINRGGIDLDISENGWNNLRDKERAEKILEALSGMSVSSAQELLDDCKRIIERAIIGIN